MERNDDLISRSALIAEYDRVHVGAPGGARKLMQDAPAVDAVEVVHGRWKDVLGGKYDNQSYRCSVCKEHALSDDKGWFLTNFCPNCGAMMDGE